MCYHLAFRREYKEYQLSDLKNSDIIEIIHDSIVDHPEYGEFYMGYSAYDICDKLKLLDWFQITNYDIDVISDHLAGVWVKGDPKTFVNYVCQQLGHA